MFREFESYKNYKQYCERLRLIMIQHLPRLSAEFKRFFVDVATAEMQQGEKGLKLAMEYWGHFTLRRNERNERIETFISGIYLSIVTSLIPLCVLGLNFWYFTSIAIAGSTFWAHFLAGDFSFCSFCIPISLKVHSCISMICKTILGRQTSWQFSPEWVKKRKMH